MQQIFTKEYWNKALNNCKDPKYLCIAAIVVALRIAVKSISIPIMPGLELTFDCYINAIGSLAYGPVVGLIVGAISDTVGAIVFPSGLYFFPFIFTEMLSSFIFGVCLWNTELSSAKIFKARFLVSFICNICLTSLFMKWYYIFFSIEGVYNIINLARIAKNLIMFPLEAALLNGFIMVVAPGLAGVVPIKTADLAFTPKKIVRLCIYFVVAVGLVLGYIIWLKPFLAAHNIKLL